MSTYFTTNLNGGFGGPFSKVWEVQKWVHDHNLDPDEWDFEEQTRERINEAYHDKCADEVAAEIDNQEHTVPCGKREFTGRSTETYGFVNETRGVVEVNVIAECTECGFKHKTNTLLSPTPNN